MDLNKLKQEAEEWVIDHVCKDCSRYEKCKSKEHCTCKECSKEKWQDGAEFGYKKAIAEIKDAYEGDGNFSAWFENYLEDRNV